MSLREFVNDAQNRPWRLSHLREEERDYASLAEVIRDATRITQAESRLAAKQYTPLAEFASFYLPENLENRRRGIDVFIQLHKLCLPENGEWYLGADRLVSFLASESKKSNEGEKYEPQRHLPRSNIARLAHNMNRAPIISWYTQNPQFDHDFLRKNVVRALTTSNDDQESFAEEVDSKEFGLLPKQRLFRLGEKQADSAEYLILEENETLLHHNQLIFHYGTFDTSGFHTQFTLKMEYAYSSYEPQGRWTNWDEDEGKRLLFLDGVPYIALSQDTQKTLASPIHMGKDADELRYGRDFDRSYLKFDGLLKGCHEWNRDAYLASGDTELGTAHYYIEVAKKAAEAVSLAVSGERLLGKPAIDPKVATEFREVFSKLSNNYNFSDIYSPTELAIAQMLWSGKEQVWNLVLEFAYYMTSAFTKDPASFFRYVRMLGLDSILPHFREMTEDEDLISFAASAFDLAPNLSKYCDHRLGGENGSKARNII